MIILDTNILSAVMQEKEDPKIVAWLDRQAWESIWTTAITVFEIRLGLSTLTKGRRPSVGRNGFLGALRRSPDAQGIALHTAPTQKAISTHQMGEYQGPLVLARTHRHSRISCGGTAAGSAPGFCSPSPRASARPISSHSSAAISGRASI
jgi:predicted nucleic acid-binding protein